MKEVVIVDGARTAFGRRGGIFRVYTPSDLAGKTIRGLCEKTGILDKGKVDAVFAGCAWGDVDCNNFARYSTLKAGLPYETSSTFIEMQCGSSIACINNAALQLQAGVIDVAIAGGAETHSRTAFKFSTCVTPFREQPPAAARMRLAPVEEDDISMIEIADRMAKKWGVTREECDRFAYDSQMRAKAAIEKGYFKDEILPIEVKYSRKSDPVIVDTDEHPRPNTTLEGLAGMRPVMEGGVTTAGNASGLNDGAAFVLMMTKEKAEELGYRPLARWVGGKDVGVDPKEMGIGPAFSNMSLLNRFGLKVSDMEVIECNEAFAAQNLSVIRQMEAMSGETIDRSRWNPLGGAIAFGHPNGASGGRLCLFTMKELIRRKGRYGLFSACCGGGLGVSTLIENIYE
ncbi:hypothetical protein BHK98_07810 [Hornefia porci]|uniref:acetyl-CoA C-acetyltransferase n=1 Tax=Hornefia porci TaxID=2652292 RepID=A0A1Q9JIC1_9FIRM|nr:thiolase family protein [Hornefia porci]OLR55972.1 hypothetical protein BHK98_07810 [Hornefia porci]